MGISEQTALFITGDILDSPTERYYHRYLSLKDRLEENDDFKVYCVPGNHDINTKGISILSNKGKIRANIVDGFNKDIFIINDDVVIFPFNSCTDGEFARGKVDVSQLATYGNKFERTNYKDKFKIALLHHHVRPIETPDWMSRRGGIFNYAHEMSLELFNANQFITWLNQREIDLVLHGHKHIPSMYHVGDTLVLASGSATGNVRHVNKYKTYSSYNVIKIGQKSIVINQYYEEDFGSGEKMLMNKVFDRFDPLEI